MTPSVQLNAVEQLTKLPAQPFSAVLVLRLVEDRDASLVEIGRLVEMDPVLAARVIRLANTPYYGHRGGVTSASRAVVLLGVSAVRAIVAAAASCLLAEDVTLGPADYWAHSIAVAAGSSVAAGALRLSENEGFSAGLLHDIGTALLHRADPTGYERLVATSAPGGLLAAERHLYGADHCEVGANALAEWHFPRAFVAAVATHHDDVSSVNPLAQAIILGETLAETLEPLRLVEVRPRLDDVIESLGFPTSVRSELLEKVRTQVHEIQRLVEGAK